MSQTRILVVEDEGIIALSIQRKLENLGYDVPVIASCGEEAICEAANIQPDLVLMDIMLDGPMDGIEAATQIWQRFKIPVVYLTANSDEANDTLPSEQTLQRAKIAEPFGYLLKPFEERELHTAIEIALYKHRMETRLRESEQRLATTLNSIGEAVISTDKEGRITFMNPVAEQLTGWKQASALSKRLPEVLHLIHQKTRQPISEPVTTVLQKAEVISLAPNTLLIAYDGTEIPIAGNAAPIKGDNSNLSGVVLALRDITERKRAERERAEQARYTKQLRVAAEVSEQISAILEPERLLSVTVTLLQERFALYHVHVYLLDQAQRLLVMQIGSGEVGRQLRKDNHTISFDEEPSIVARVARTKQAILVNDTRTSATFLPNPLLPGTRSEVAVPLIVAGRLLGVLDVQDNQPNRFTQADMDVFNTLAGQVATALENARLYDTRRQAEQALRESDLRFRSLIQSASDAIILADTTGNIIEWNAGAQAIFGYQEEEILGQPLQLIMPRRYRAAHEHGLKRLQATGVPHVIGQTVEMHGLRKDGTEFPLEIALTTWSTEAGTFYSGIIRDITKRKRAEEERYRFTNQLHTAADLAQQINAILDLNELLAKTVALLQSRFTLYHVHIYLLDESTQQLVMHTGSGEVGQRLRQRGHAIPFSRQKSLVARAARKQEIVLVNEVRDEPAFMPNPLLPDTRSEVAVPLIVGDRVLGVFDVQDDKPQRFTPSELDVLRTLAGQVATAIQNARLFEQVQQSLDETQRTAERLRELDRLKSEFLASMSHELRTPLNSIIGYAEIILMGLNGPLNEEMTEDIEAIRNSGQHLLHLINDILDLAKIEAGRMTLGYEEVDISGVLDQVRVSHLALLRDKPVELLIEMGQKVPPIEADRLRLNQILTNLVTNAIKFTEKGIVSLHTTHNEGWMQIAVQDEGIGMKESDLATIFEQFRQVDGSNTRRAGGTGLGLAITNHLVQLHGGTITVESELDKGSTFFVRLPVKRPPEEL